MSWLTSRHAIQAAIERGASGTLYLVRKNTRVSDVAEAAAQRGVPVRYVTSDKLKRIAGNSTRGAAFQLSEENPASGRTIDLKSWLSEYRDTLPSPILVLDHITDPHNVGAILRSAHWFGAALIVIPAKRSATSGDVVARSSAGAVSLVDITYVANLRNAIEACKAAGYWVYAADADGVDVSKTRINAPTLLVLGAEGKGISPGLEKVIDSKIRIPGNKKSESSVDSLNVSVSAGVLLYALRVTDRY